MKQIFNSWLNLKLDNLVIIYDSNNITLKVKQLLLEENVKKIFVIDLEVIEIDGHNFETN